MDKVIKGLGNGVLLSSFVWGLILVLLFLSGCGSLMGVRNFEAWEGGPRWEFAEGQDFHLGFNAIDNVDNKRGVHPGAQGRVKKDEKRY